MAWTDPAAFIRGTRWCHKKVVAVDSGAIDVHRPVPGGSVAGVTARAAGTGRTSMTIPVEMWIEPMNRADRVPTCRGEHELAAVDERSLPVPVPHFRPPI